MIHRLILASRALAAANRPENRNGNAMIVPRDSLRDLAQAAEAYFHHPPGTCSTCRSCGAPIFWIETASGARKPLDHAAIQAYNAEGERIRVHLDHFTTCPDGADWRGKKRGDPDTPDRQPQLCGASVRRSGIRAGACALEPGHDGSCATSYELRRSAS